MALLNLILSPTITENADTVGGKNEESAFEIVFVIDRSGSMAKWYMDLAKEAALLLVSSLPLHCRFQIVGFGTKMDHLFRDPYVEQYSDASKTRAMKYITTMHSNFGGTDILSPLQFIASQGRTKRFRSQTESTSEPAELLPRYIMVLTDGEVTELDKVLSFVGIDSRHHGTKYFTVGIGSGASRALIEGCAREGNGAFEMIDDNDLATGALARKMLRQLDRIISPSLHDIRLEWNNSLVWQSVETPRNLYQDTKQTVFAELSRSDGQGPVNGVTILGTTRNQDNYREDVQGESIRLVSGLMLRRFAAKSSLQALERQGQRAAAVKLSLATGVVCRWTSLVAAETHDLGSDGMSAPKVSVIRQQVVTIASRRHQSVHYDHSSAHGTSGSVQLSGGSAVGGSVSVSSETPFASGSSGSLTFTSGASIVGRSTVGRSIVGGSTSVECSSPFFEASFFATLLALQTVDGRWAPGPDLWRLLFPTWKDYKLINDFYSSLQLPEMGNLSQTNLTDDMLWSTLVTVMVLTRKYDSVKDRAVWQMAANKSMRYLSDATGWPLIESKSAEVKRYDLIVPSRVLHSVEMLLGTGSQNE